MQSKIARLALLVLALSGVAYGRDQSEAPVVVGLDHIPLAVGNLESAADRFRSLGFALKPGRPHDDGIRNQHVKFPDGTEIELITAAEARDALTAHYVRHLAKGDGPAFAGLYAPSIAAAGARLSAGRFEHAEDTGAITFPETNELQYLFIGSRNRTPTDLPAHFAHENTAESLIGLWLASENPSTELRLLKQLGAQVSDRYAHVPDRRRCPVARFAEGEVVLLPSDRQQIPGRRIVGATLRVRDLSAVQSVLAKNAINASSVIQTKAGRSVFVPPQAAHGLWLEFRELR